MQRELENTLAELVLGKELALDDRDAVRTWLLRHGIPPDDAEAIVQQGIERFLIYRKLVRHNLRETLTLAIGRSIARLGPVFDEYFDRFLAERGPRTHYLRDVTRELLEYCAPLWREDPRVPEYILDLAHHEALQIEVGALQVRPIGAEAGPLELDRGVRFIEAARLARYRYAVHRLSEGERDRTLPLHENIALFVYRNPEHEVRYLELSPLAATIIERLLAGVTLREAMLDAPAQHGASLSEQVVEGSARLLSDLAERGALLGAAAPVDHDLA
jgi:hypothetical protein